MRSSNARYSSESEFYIFLLFNKHSLSSALSSLSAALSLDLRNQLGITHIVSVCPEYPSTGPHHLVIAVDDSEYENLLIHLPQACQFMQAALENDGGKVLVHCVMGISRSATVVAAYCECSRYRLPFRSLTKLK